MTRVWLWPLVGGAATALILYLWRGFFPQHALIIGLGVAALIFTAIRTVVNLRSLHGRRDR